jgi:hypothetical protein
VKGDDSATELVWEVGPDLIDLDHWARSYVAIRVAQKQDERSAFQRYGFWPIMALVVIVVGTTSSVALAAIPVVVGALGFVGAKLWNRRAAARLATRLRDLPAASEPFTFRAGPNGTESHSASGSEALSWARYTSARIVGDLLVLTLDTKVVRLLPMRALASGQQAQDALATIGAWIERARSGQRHGARP